MGLFSMSQIDKVNQVAAKSKEVLEPPKAVKTKSISDDLARISADVEAYFEGSPAICIRTKEELHDYIDKCLEVGYAGIDTETTGLDTVHDTIVGFSLYYPGGVECYIPCKHIIPIFDSPYKDQMSYEDVHDELIRLANGAIKLIFANAIFDLSMIAKDFKVDLTGSFYYDVILAWRCLKENELDNSLKGLYAKYPGKGKVDPKKFSDFFPPSLFPYSNPEIAKLYAANDAKITYDLFVWQLPYVTPSHPKCQKAHLEHIADLIWNVEFPLVSLCFAMHDKGMYFDRSLIPILHSRYHKRLDVEKDKLRDMVEEIMSQSAYESSLNTKRPFRTAKDFNPGSPPHVQYLVYDLLHVEVGKDGRTTNKDFLRSLNLPAVNQILKVRSLSKLISSFIDALPKSATADSRIHAGFKQLGADTGRLSCIAKGTKVSCCVNGALLTVPIEDVKVGQQVYCYDDNNILQVRRVTGVYLTGIRKCLKLKWVSNANPTIHGQLVCTPDHFIKTIAKGWIESERLTHYDCLLGDIPAAGLLNVTSVERLEELYEVYDITVEDFHNFIAGGVCVHNCENPNLMNIPSHAADVRHLFRATPSEFLNEDCDYDEDNDKIEIETDEINYVTILVDDNEQEILVRDLQVGQSLKLLADGKEIWKNVSEVSTSDKDTTLRRIVL